MILIYNIMIFFNTIQLFAELGAFIQNKVQSQNYESKMNSHNYSSTFFVPYLIGIFLFYVFAITLSFIFYRECKQSKILGPGNNEQNNPQSSYGTVNQSSAQENSQNNGGAGNIFGASNPSMSTMSNIRSQGKNDEEAAPQKPTFPGSGMKVG
mmetsp:Transcript_12561/g.14126  ORF Transcript_12561/g.14126 Transcript_12561/m.14126 type:complete len:153 (-) Transcript_12561:23-481(-)